MERLTLVGVSVEDERNNFTIKHFVNQNDRLKLVETIKLLNKDKAINKFDKWLFDTSEK